MRRKIVISGAAGLVGQNLIARLVAQHPDWELVGIDKHPTNTSLLRKLHPQLNVIEADIATPGAWSDAFDGASAIVLNQAQIGGLVLDEFNRNNVVASERAIEAAHRFHVPYMVHVSSSVVRSKAVDAYSETKRRQEEIVGACGLKHVSLRPTLMFGWFDRKHLGWLRRFMDRTPVFPIPGSGAYLRQPLYAGDFVSVIASCLDHEHTGQHDISGRQPLTYGELIRLIHEITKPRARIVNIPYGLFWLLLWAYAKVNANPPFTTSQLEALVIPETFPITEWPTRFGVAETPLRTALEETFLDPRYSSIVLDF
jgi:nucleoside-diphosphate-sugar epimerase